MSEKTQPFQVICHLEDGRVNSADGLFFLDSILYHAWFMKYEPQVLQGIYKEEHSKHFGLPLKQDQENNRYFASCGFYTQYSFDIEYWNKRPDFSSGKNGSFLDTKGKINTTAGEFKAYHFPQTIRLISDIEFYGYGTVSKVKDLLSYINFIGKKNSIGYGKIRYWEVNEWHEDWSTYGKYGLMRPMPIEICVPPVPESYRIGQCAIRPPAWKATNQMVCYIPNCQI